MVWYLAQKREPFQISQIGSFKSSKSYGFLIPTHPLKTVCTNVSNYYENQITNLGFFDGLCQYVGYDRCCEIQSASMQKQNPTSQIEK